MLLQLQLCRKWASQQKHRPKQPAGQLLSPAMSSQVRLCLNVSCSCLLHHLQVHLSFKKFPSGHQLAFFSPTLLQVEQYCEQ